MRKRAVCVATWWFGVDPVREGLRVLGGGGTPLDAVTAGAEIAELDPRVMTVGLGGYPDASGRATLDACVMIGEGNRSGAVVALPRIATPTAVARRVMERTPHVLLAGEGALRFAKAQGFRARDLSTPASRAAYRNWLAESKARKKPGGHDTLGILALDPEGRLAGACTSSGLRFKLPGRVGDSPIVGAGLYVDEEIGAVVGTGRGEEILSIAGSVRVLEAMRRGLDPGEACADALRYLLRKRPVQSDQVAFLALRKDGAHGAAALREGFCYAWGPAGADTAVALREIPPLSGTL